MYTDKRENRNWTDRLEKQFLRIFKNTYFCKYFFFCIYTTRGSTLFGCYREGSTCGNVGGRRRENSSKSDETSTVQSLCSEKVEIVTDYLIWREIILTFLSFHIRLDAQFFTSYSPWYLSVFLTHVFLLKNNTFSKVLITSTTHLISSSSLTVPYHFLSSMSSPCSRWTYSPPSPYFMKGWRISVHFSTTNQLEGWL